MAYCPTCMDAEWACQRCDDEAAPLATPDHPNRGRVEATFALFDRRPDLRTIGAAGVMVAASLSG